MTFDSRARHGRMTSNRWAFLTVLLLFSLRSSAASWSVQSEEKKQENGEAEVHSKIPYGVDVSFPMHHDTVSTNYAWLPHNVDPSLPTPDKYKGMPINPIGDTGKAYKDFIDGCTKKWGDKGKRRCLSTEEDRVEMSLRQPQSMQV